MVMTGRVHDMILDPKQTGMLGEVVAEGGYYGMQTFDQHLLEHLAAGRVTMEDAVRVASSPHDFKLMVAAQARIAPRAHPDKDGVEGAPAPAAAPPAPPVASQPPAAPPTAPPAAPPVAPPVASQPPVAPPVAPPAPPAPAGPPPGASAPPPGVPS
jgi:twitching motility protein PilT